MNAEDKKHCRKCGVELVAGDNWTAALSEHHSYICKACDKKRASRWHAANRERANSKARARYKANPKRDRLKNDQWQKNNPHLTMLHRAKARAKRDGVAFLLHTNDVAENKLCPALGLEIRWGAGAGSRRTAHESRSLDKVIPSVGYVPGNVCVISHRANTIKWDATPEESLAVALYSYTYTGHSVSDIHAAVDAILAKQAEYARINEAARNIDTAQHSKA